MLGKLLNIPQPAADQIGGIGRGMHSGVNVTAQNGADCIGHRIRYQPRHGGLGIVAPCVHHIGLMPYCIPAALGLKADA